MEEETTSAAAEESQKKLEQDSILLSAELREWWVLNVMKYPEEFCVRRKITPNIITVIGLVLIFVCGLLFASNHILSAGWMILITGSLDILDGRVARATNQVSSSGAFLDSVADRYGDFFIFSGLCVYFRDSGMLWIVLAAMGGSYLVSYVRSKATEIGVDLARIGSMQRPERLFLLGFGSLVSSILQVSLMPFYPHHAPPPQHVLIMVLIFMAFSTNWTAVKRIRYTMDAMKDRGAKE